MTPRALGGEALKELEWRQIAGEVYLVASVSADNRRVAFAVTSVVVAWRRLRRNVPAR